MGCARPWCCGVSGWPVLGRIKSFHGSYRLTKTPQVRYVSSRTLGSTCLAPEDVETCSPRHWELLRRTRMEKSSPCPVWLWLTTMKPGIFRHSPRGFFRLPQKNLWVPRASPRTTTPSRLKPSMRNTCREKNENSRSLSKPLQP